MPVLSVALDVPVPRLFDYTAEDAVSSDVGQRVLVPFGRGRRVGIILAIGDDSVLPAERLRPAERILRDLPALPAHCLDLVGFCSRYYHHAIGEVAALALPPALKATGRLAAARDRSIWALTPAGRPAIESLPRRSRVRRLLVALCDGPLARDLIATRLRGATALLAEAEGSGWVERVIDRSSRQGETPPVLSAQQREAVSQVRAAGEGYAAFLLFGVTGSGKTEVYLDLIGDQLAAGRQVLILAPEIGLTPQLQARVAARFPGATLVGLHSALSEAQRLRAHRQALSGEAQIVVGTRLAVFSPLERLGLIVVDEEHDPSFKQQDGVRYSARDLAVYRASRQGVPIVLGSATPSLESWHHALGGRYRLLALGERARSAQLPRVRCVDTRRVKVDEGLSAPLIEAIGSRLERGEQCLVFLNRRGYAPVITCMACGWVSGCRHCSAHLVVHAVDRSLRCHHCGYREAVPLACPVCGNQDLRPVGRGTQRLESALRARFARARILRVDRDSVRSAAQWNAALAAIRDHSAELIVGTQILAKGHDFPKLTLVGVINADASLFAADFRAPERLFAQLMQVAGRSGRADLPGEVLVQTDFPDHPLFASLVAHDYEGFARAQLADRQAAGFPPFRHQALLRAEAPSLAETLAFLSRARAVAEPLRGEQIDLYDPVPMRLTRRAGQERAQLLIESAQRSALQAFLDEWLAALHGSKGGRDLRWHIDIDPLDL